MYRFLEETVAGYMTRSVKTVTRDLTVRELGAMFERDDFNTYPVEEDGQAVGIVTKFDLLKCFAFTPSQMVPRYGELMNRMVANVMIAEFIYVRPDTKLTRVLQLMVEHRIRSIPVIDGDQRLAGIIAREDVARALASCASDEARSTRSPHRHPPKSLISGEKPRVESQRRRIFVQTERR